MCEESLERKRPQVKVRKGTLQDTLPKQYEQRNKNNQAIEKAQESDISHSRFPRGREAASCGIPLAQAYVCSAH